MNFLLCTLQCCTLQCTLQCCSLCIRFMKSIALLLTCRHQSCKFPSTVICEYSLRKYEIDGRFTYELIPAMKSLLSTAEHFSFRKRVEMDAQHYKINQLFMSWIDQWPEQSAFKRFFFCFHLTFAANFVCWFTH